jgi:hypothetical protein
MLIVADESLIGFWLPHRNELGGAFDCYGRETPSMLTIGF